MYLCSRLFSALSVTLMCQACFAFDTSVFERLDENSVKNAKAFLALPGVEKETIAIKQLENDKLKPAWRLLLWSSLGQSDITPALFEQLEDLSAYELREQLSAETEAEQILSTQLCLLQVQQHIAPRVSSDQEYGESEVEFDLITTQQVCAGTLEAIINTEPAFKLLFQAIKEPDHDLHDTFLKYSQYYKALTPEQQKQVLAALIQLATNNETSDTYRIGEYVASLESKERETFITALEQYAKRFNNTNDTEALEELYTLLVALEDEQAMELFWNLAFVSPKNNLPSAKYILFSNYYAADEPLSPALAHAILTRLKNNNNWKEAALYMYLLIESEGFFWSDITDLAKVLAELKPPTSQDSQLQGVYKYLALQNAAIAYSTRHEISDDVEQWLAKAHAIPAAPLSWYEHITQTEVTPHFDEREEFMLIKKLYANGQFAVLKQAIDTQQLPTQALLDLPLGLYKQLLKTDFRQRIWHNPTTGEALLIDSEAHLGSFNGFELAHESSSFTKLEIAQSATDVTSPSLTSPLTAWLKYVMATLEDEPDSAVVAIDDEIAREDRQVDERLFLSQYDTELELVRYGANVLVTVVLRGEVGQHWITWPSTEQAQHWLTTLRQTPPSSLTVHDLWTEVVERYAEEEASDTTSTPAQPTYNIVARYYRLPDHSAVDKIVLSPAYANSEFRYPTRGCENLTINPTALAQNSQGFNQAEWALYQKGYVLSKIEFNTACLSE